MAMATSTISTTPAALVVLAALCFGPAPVPVVLLGEAYGADRLVCACGQFDVPLTPALYKQGRKAYRTATCVDRAFHSYIGDVIIKQGLPNLKTVDSQAFHSFRGKLVLSGSFPKLQCIHSQVFHNAGNAASVLDFSLGLPALTTIGSQAFYEFKGSITFGGDYPCLEKCYTQYTPYVKLCRTARTCAAGEYLDASSNVCATYVI